NLLAKLGTSLGHMDPKKHGLTMCEIFGAYGWSEGLKMMKWLADHMLVRGVNVFVPHAFTLSAFPDPDCPPHFYADGNNPQYPYFRELMGYMNRVSHLITGGRHIPCVALLYSAEGEWMDAEAQPLEEVCLALNRAQIDYEIVPGDVLVDAPMDGGRFTVGQESMGALVVSRRRCMSARLCSWCRRAAAAGVPVLFLDAEPEQVDPANGGLPSPAATGGRVVPGEQLVDTLRAMHLAELVCDSPQPYLRYYHYAHEDGELLLLFNEDPLHDIDCQLRTPLGEQVRWYDPWTNDMLAAEQHAGQVHVHLTPYQMMILTTAADGGLRPRLREDARQQTLEGAWRLTMIPAGQTEPLADRTLPQLASLCAPGLFPHFSGTMIYRKEFLLDEGETRLELDLGQVYETAQVFINGTEAGVRIAPPYAFRAEGAMLHPGENLLEIHVMNTLGNQMRDAYSMSLPMEPTGLLGPVTLRAE
ncbi:MAG: hypothetical protein ACI4ML_09625, partial [Aristaeellaceae bacterium]